MKTNLGSRIRDLKSSPAFKNGKVYPTSLKISFHYYTEEILIVDETSRHQPGDDFHFPPKEHIPSCVNWDDTSWSDFFDSFKSTHQGQLPNFIAVKFSTGWGMTYKDFTVCFRPTGEILYVDFTTNESNVYTPNGTSLSTYISPEDEPDLVTLLDLEKYVKLTVTCGKYR